MGGQTALHRASWNGHLDTVDVLVELGSPIGSKDIHGNTPKQLAEENGKHDAALLLERLEIRKHGEQKSEISIDVEQREAFIARALSESRRMEEEAGRSEQKSRVEVEANARMRMEETGLQGSGGFPTPAWDALAAASHD